MISVPVISPFSMVTDGEAVGVAKVAGALGLKAAFAKGGDCELHVRTAFHAGCYADSPMVTLILLLIPVLVRDYISRLDCLPAGHLIPARALARTFSRALPLRGICLPSSTLQKRKRTVSQIDGSPIPILRV